MKAVLKSLTEEEKRRQSEVGALLPTDLNYGRIILYGLIGNRIMKYNWPNFTPILARNSLKGADSFLEALHVVFKIFYCFLQNFSF